MNPLFKYIDCHAGIHEVSCRKLLHESLHGNLYLNKGFIRKTLNQSPYSPFCAMTHIEITRWRNQNFQKTRNKIKFTYLNNKLGAKRLMKESYSYLPTNSYVNPAGSDPKSAESAEKVRRDGQRAVLHETHARKDDSRQRGQLSRQSGSGPISERRYIRDCCSSWRPFLRTPNQLTQRSLVIGREGDAVTSAGATASFYSGRNEFEGKCSSPRNFVSFYMFKCSKARLFIDKREA